jgi:oligopeptide transport system ATP-binding protein
MPPLLRVDHLKKYFPLREGFLRKSRKSVRAVDDISFEVNKGETLALVGESGCGKTTVGRCILRLIEPTAGQIVFNEKNITSLPYSEIRHVRRSLQIIFQDPYGSLTPRLRLYSLLKEPLDIHGIATESDRKTMVASALEKVGLKPEYMNRFPHEFSGGQRQRIAIARALILQPALIIADEPVSALDVSIQAQIINLMVKLQMELGLSYLFISHDLKVVKYMADSIGVMYLGKIVEMASADDLYRDYQHPYTEALLSAIPGTTLGATKDRIVLKGEAPSPIEPPSGCKFHPRCSYRIQMCERSEPELNRLGEGHFVACHLRTGRN